MRVCMANGYGTNRVKRGHGSLRWTWHRTGLREIGFGCDEARSSTSTVSEPAGCPAISCEHAHAKRRDVAHA